MRDAAVDLTKALDLTGEGEVRQAKRLGLAFFVERFSPRARSHKPDKPVVNFIFKFKLNIAPFAVLLSNSGPLAMAQMDKKD